MPRPTIEARQKYENIHSKTMNAFLSEICRTFSGENLTLLERLHRKNVSTVISEHHLINWKHNLF